MHKIIQIKLISFTLKYISCYEWKKSLPAAVSPLQMSCKMPLSEELEQLK